MAKVRKYFLYVLFAFMNGYILGTGFILSKAVYRPIYNNSSIYAITSVKETDIPLQIFLTAALTVGFLVLFLIKRKVYRWLTPLCVVIFSFCIFNGIFFSLPYAALALSLVAVVMVYVFKETFPETARPFLKGKYLYTAIGIMTALMMAAITLASVYRHLTFNSNTFDLGLYVQMYESMATDFTQVTTLERGKPISHFAVHFSPIYYALVPVYMIFRSPECLLAAQAVLAFSGIIPLLLLCRRWKYSENLTFLISVVFLFYPCFSSPCFFDFHENAFLTPLILWTLYFIEKNNIAGIAVFSVLLLLVKTEVGFFVAALGLYCIFDKRRKKMKITGAAMIIAGAAVFLIITYFINKYGYEVQSQRRYGGFMVSDQTSLTDAIINVIKNPALLFNTIMNADKLLMITEMMLPLMFIPAMTRKLSAWVLYIPFAIISLFSTYFPQYSVNYQYVFGTGAIFVFLFAKNLRYFRKKIKPAAAGALASLIFFAGINAYGFNFISDYKDKKDDYIAAEQVLADIPRDAVVMATEHLNPHMADIKELYLIPEYYEPGTVQADYVLLDNRTYINSGVYSHVTYKQLLKYYSGKGYVVISDQDVSFVTVMKYDEAAAAAAENAYTEEGSELEQDNTDYGMYRIS